MTNTTIPNQLYPVANALASSNPFVDVFEARDPTTADINYPIQKKWLNTATDAFWELESFSTFNGITTANWVELNSSGPVIEKLQGNTGPAVPPLAQIINVLGDGTFIQTVGNAATHTLTIEVAGSLATTYDGDTGSAVASANILNVIGNPSVEVVGSGNTLSISINNPIHLWTPTVMGGTIAGATTYTLQSASYTRTGSTVFVQCSVTWSAATGTGDLIVTGLPYTIGGAQPRAPIGSAWLESMTWPIGVTYIVCYGADATKDVYFEGQQASMGALRVQMQNTGNIQFSLTYETGDPF